MVLISEESSLNDAEQELYTEVDAEAETESSSSPRPSCSSTMLTPVDPEPHMSSQFYTFNRASHRLMVRCLMAARVPTPDEVRSVATPAVLTSWRGVWKDRTEDTAYVTGWRRIQDKLLAQVDDVGNEVLFFKNNPYQFVPFLEQWAGIVQQFHVGPDLKHLPYKETLERMRQVWTVGAKLYGVPETYVKVCISTCPLCGNGPVEQNPNQNQQPQPVMVEVAKGESRRKRFEYTESFEVVARDVPQRLQHLADKYKVVLCIRQKYIRYKPFLAEVKDYCCHRGGEPTGKKLGVLKRKRYMSKRCGCSFRIRAIVPIMNYDEKEKTFTYQDDGMATFKLYAVHSGHEPGPHEGSARIIHRFVDPSTVSEEAEKEEEEEARQGVLRQIQELQVQLGGLEQKLAGTSLEVLNSVCQDVSTSLQRLRKIDRGAKAVQEQNSPMFDRLSEQQQLLLQQQQAQENSGRTSKKTCGRCCSKECLPAGSGFCKSCEVFMRHNNSSSSNNNASCSEEVSLDMSGYCTENDKWYEGMACGLDAAAHGVELGFGHAIS